MYQIFIVINRDFGEIEMLDYEDRDLANAVWKDFMRNGNPIITVSDNKFKVFNAPMCHQPKTLKAEDWPQWATDLWIIRKDDEKYLGARLIDWDSIGCFELRHTTTTDAGMKKTEREFRTYRGLKMFSVTEYD